MALAFAISFALDASTSRVEVTASVVEPFDVRASSTDYVAYDPAALRAAGLVDAGRILDGGSGDYHVLYRPGFVVLRVHEPAFVPELPWVRGQPGYG